MSSLTEWIAARRPQPPVPLREWLGDLETPEGQEAGASALAAAGEVRLRLALAMPGRRREAAFHLLAADACWTWSTEAAMEEEDPEPLLRALIRRAAGEAG